MVCPIVQFEGAFFTLQKPDSDHSFDKLAVLAWPNYR
jgi:hypothetical protein